MSQITQWRCPKCLETFEKTFEDGETKIVCPKCGEMRKGYIYEFLYRYKIIVEDTIRNFKLQIIRKITTRKQIFYIIRLSGSETRELEIDNVDDCIFRNTLMLLEKEVYSDYTWIDVVEAVFVKNNLPLECPIRDRETGKTAKTVTMGVSEILKPSKDEVVTEKPVIKLSDRIHFDASLIGSTIQVKAVIAGESKHKTLPEKFLVKCLNCSFNNSIALIDLVKDSPIAIVAYLKNDLKTLKQFAEESLKNEHCPNSKKPHELIFEVEDWIDYRIFTLRDVVEKTDYANPISEYIDAFAVEEHAKASPLKKYLITCVPVPHPKTDELSVFITKMEPLLDDYSNYKPTPEDIKMFKQHFYVSPPSLEWSEIKKTYQNIKQKINKSHAPHIRKCEHSKLADMLVSHSKMWIIRPDGKQIRGWLRSAKYGDTGTGKGETLREITNSIGVGEKFVGESTGRTGLLYYIDPERKQLIWGALVLNDGTVVVIEGLHGVYVDEIVQQREALDSGIIKVQRMLSGEALARTRIICDMNPKEPIATAGIYKCQALFKLPNIREAPDIRRWDIWIPHFIGQASPEDIAMSHYEQPLIPYEVMRKHCLLAWKDKEIIWGKDIVNYIDNSSEYLLKKYQSDILPLINNDVKNCLYRITVAFAQLTDSYSEDYSKLYVQLWHVQLALIFIEENLQENEYDLYVLEERQLFKLSEKEESEIITKMLKTDLDILMALKIGSLQSSVIAEKIDKTEITVRRRAKKLKGWRLIDVELGRGGGYKLTAKGIKLLKSLLKQTNVLEEIMKKDIEELTTTQTGKCSICGKEAELKYKWKGYSICEKCKEDVEEGSV